MRISKLAFITKAKMVITQLFIIFFTIITLTCSFNLETGQDTYKLIQSPLLEKKGKTVSNRFKTFTNEISSTYFGFDFVLENGYIFSLKSAKYD